MTKLRNQHGFTLIELLVALVIIGIIVASATLMFRDSGRDQYQEEKRRLLVLLNLAQEEAMLQSISFGIGFWEQGYSFYELSAMIDEQGKPVWEPLKDTHLRARELFDRMELKLNLEGKDIVMSAVAETEPQVFVLASGETTPFELSLFYDNKPQTTIKVDALGQVELIEADEDDF